MRIDHENLVKAYVNCCYGTPLQETFCIDFHNILHRKVRLRQQTEQNLPIFNLGRSHLIKLFRHFIYGHKSTVTNPTYEVSDWNDPTTQEEGVKLSVIAEETLDECPGESREIHETTYFKFKKNSKGKDKISHIQMYFDKVVILST